MPLTCQRTGTSSLRLPHALVQLRAGATNSSSAHNAGC